MRNKTLNFGSVKLTKFTFNQFEKGFNAKLVSKMYLHTHRHTVQKLIILTTFHCAIHLNQQAHQRQSLLPSISLPAPDGVIEGCKEEDVQPSASIAPPPHTGTALKCLWVFMFVMFYRSGQEPEAVKVWKAGEGDGKGGEEDRSYCKFNLY